MEFKSFYKAAGGGEGGRCKYPVRLDTYGKGCAHNCAYCYARSLLAFRGLWNPKAPAVADIHKIRATIFNKCRKGDIVRLGGMTDCFQPIEKDYRVTYKTIDALNKRGIGYLIVTKSDLVAAPEYLSIMDKRLAHIQISITSTDDFISKDIEPGASLPSERIRAVEILQKEGFDVAVRLSPFIPQFLDMRIINEIKCDKFQVEFLRVNSWIKKWLGGCGVSTGEYTLKEGGYRHLPLANKIEYLGAINGHTVSICEDVDAHFQYWKEHHNPNPEDCCNLSK